MTARTTTTRKAMKAVKKELKETKEALKATKDRVWKLEKKQWEMEKDIDALWKVTNGLHMLSTRIERLELHAPSPVSPTMSQETMQS
jgi:DNA anti-recombination protein RmuC